MAVRLITSEKAQRRSYPLIAISYKLKRATLNNHAVDMLTRKNGSDFNYVQFLVDDERPGIFWVKLLTKNAHASKLAAAGSPRTRNFSVSVVMTELKWKLKETSRYSIEWDDTLKAGMVDTNKRLDVSNIVTPQLLAANK